MKLHVSKISPGTLTLDDQKRYSEINDQAFGASLAKRVAAKLKANPGESGGLYFAHRDYCGMGLYMENGCFVMGTVNDGRGPSPIVASFESENEFVAWLSEQSDQSMALYGTEFNNQTISRIRLEWYMDADYNASWNTYCLYLTERLNER